MFLFLFHFILHYWGVYTPCSRYCLLEQALNSSFHIPKIFPEYYPNGYLYPNPKP